jgi:pimeloyl-ACP methyl ester carboxylesterase
MTQRPTLKLTLTVAALLTLAVILTAAPRPTPTQAQGPDPADAPSYTNEICPFRLPEEIGVECGLMTVLEDRDNPDSRALQLQVIRVNSQSEAPADIPILMMHGDRGQGSIQQLIEELEGPLNPLTETNTIYIMDARGTGYSAPGMNCPAVELLYYERLNLNPDAAIDAELANAAVDRCYQRLASVNQMGAFTIETAVQDFIELQAALGITEWHLIASGEATRVGFELLRRVPDQITSAVLDSPAPPNARLAVEGDAAVLAAYNALFDACTDTCAQVYPDLRGTFLGVVELLNLEPVVFPVRNPVQGTAANFTLNGTTFAHWIGRLLPQDEFTPLVPLLIQQAAAGEFVELVRIINAELEEPALQSEAIRLIDACTAPATDDLVAVVETQPDADLSAALDGHVITLLGDYDCAFFPVEADAAGRFDPVTSEVPTLLLSGEFDAVTPPAWAKLAAESLPNSTLVDVPGRGYITLDNACTVELVQQWLTVPGLALDTACLFDLVINFRLTPLG